jgi:glyoxylate reductase
LPGSALASLPDTVDLEVFDGAAGPDPDTLVRRAACADGLLCLLTDRIDAALLDACPNLRVISSCSVGLDHVDLAACTARGVPVGHTPGVLTETTAELTIALLFAAARRVVEADRFVRAGRWQTWDPELLLGRDLGGSILGVIGLGAIGCAVAARARALGMEVVGWSRSGREVPGVRSVSFGELLRSSDFVSVHVALTEETRGLLAEEALAQLKPGAILINTARGGIVDEPALAKRLVAGTIAAAGLDVFSEEPLPADSPLYRLENAILLPHIGSASFRTRARMADLAVENVLAGLSGERLPQCGNSEVYDAATAEKGSG